MSLTSKDWSIIMMGIAASIILGILAKMWDFTFENISLIKGIITIVGIMLLFVFAVFFIIRKRINEINEQLDSHELEQKKLIERLKIYEELINMKADIKELQRR